MQSGRHIRIGWYYITTGLSCRLGIRKVDGRYCTSVELCISFVLCCAWWCHETLSVLLASFARGTRRSSVGSVHEGPAIRALMFLWCWLEYIYDQKFGLPVIWAAMVWRHCNDFSEIRYSLFLPISIRLTSPVLVLSYYHITTKPRTFNKVVRKLHRIYSRVPL